MGWVMADRSTVPDQPEEQMQRPSSLQWEAAAVYICASSSLRDASLMPALRHPNPARINKPPPLPHQFSIGGQPALLATKRGGNASAAEKMVLVVQHRSVHVEVPDCPSLRLFTNFSISFWVNPETQSDRPGYQKEVGWPCYLCKTRSWDNGFGFYGVQTPLPPSPAPS